MKLKEFLKKHSGMSVKIACKNGSNFFFCADTNDKRLADIIAWRNEERKEDVKKLISKRNELEEKLRNIMWELDQPEDLLDREVVDTYPSIIDRREKIVLIAGVKDGTYWDREEFDKGYKKEVKLHE